MGEGGGRESLCRNFLRPGASLRAALGGCPAQHSREDGERAEVPICVRPCRSSDMSVSLA